jgi:hypothetical protein
MLRASACCFLLFAGCHAAINSAEPKAESAKQATSETVAKIHSIDLIQGKVNGLEIFKMNLDEVTDAFGRPSRSLVYHSYERHDDKSTHHVGTCIIYGDAGVLFAFEHPDVDAKEPCIGVKVLLEAMPDFPAEGSGPGGIGHALAMGLPVAYGGALSGGISRQWKAKHFLKAFTSHGPTLEKPNHMWHVATFESQQHKVSGHFRGDTSYILALSMHLKGKVISYPR